MDMEAKLIAPERGRLDEPEVGANIRSPVRPVRPRTFEARESARLTLQRFPKVMAKLAE